jgi:hypothetical protein
MTLDQTTTATLDGTAPITGEQLYALLPAALRRRDQGAGGTVQALLDVLAAQLATVDADIERLGEDWFIETCADWVVPYLGDLLGVTGVNPVPGAAATAGRARVANTLRFRRRKGTLAMLEQLARDCTGWPAKAVELFELLATTQHLNHLRPHRPATADLRRGDPLELVGGPFDSFAHTVDVRWMRGRHGWFNIPNVGLFVWPVGSYWLDRVTGSPVADPEDGRYQIDPLGADRPLFMPPATETELEQFAQEENVPGLLRRRPLYQELEQYRAAVSAGNPPPERFFGPRPVFRAFAAASGGDPLLEVPPERLHACDLSTWRRPAQAGHVLVDPVLGRLAFPTGQVPDRVRVSSAYGAAGEVGAGSYPRRDGLAVVLDRPVDWQVGVRVPEPGDPADPELFDDLASAVAAWNAWQDTRTRMFGLITIMDNHRYQGDLAGIGGRIRVGAGNKLALVAAGWPDLPLPGGAPGQTVRRPGRIEPVGLRPCVAGRIEVLGTAGPAEEPGELLLDGLLVDGDLRVAGGVSANLGRLVVQHTSLVPEAGGLQVNSGNPRLSVELHRCLSGPVTLPDPVRRLRVSHSVLQATAVRALDTKDTEVTVEGSTLLGTTACRELSASNTIFTGKVQVERRQTGCVRFSYLPPGSQTPRRHRCQPDLAVAGSELPAATVAARIAPSFVSDQFGHFGYGQLAPETAPEVATGADDGTEMGGFGANRRPQRLANLAGCLDEYLPFGLDAAALPVTPSSRSEQ